MCQIQTGVRRSKVKVIDEEAGERNSRRTDSGNYEKHGKGRVTVDVASSNQTNSGKYKPCNVQRLNSFTLTRDFRGHKRIRQSTANFPALLQEFRYAKWSRSNNKNFYLCTMLQSSHCNVPHIIGLHHCVPCLPGKLDSMLDVQNE